MDIEISCLPIHIGNAQIRVNEGCSKVPHDENYITDVHPFRETHSPVTSLLKLCFSTSSLILNCLSRVRVLLLLGNEF